MQLRGERAGSGSAVLGLLQSGSGVLASGVDVVMATGDNRATARAMSVLPVPVPPLLAESLAAGLPGAVQNQQARMLLPGHDVPHQDMAVERDTEDACHRAPHSASRRPDERVRRRATAASKTDRVPHISTRERARVRAV